MNAPAVEAVEGTLCARHDYNRGGMLLLDCAYGIIDLSVLQWSATCRPHFSEAMQLLATGMVQ